MSFLGYKNIGSFYTGKLWRSLRGFKLDKNPLCEDCEPKGFVTIADDVDHIKPIGDANSQLEAETLALSIDNLKSLCKSCHATKTSQDRKKRKIKKLFNKKWKL